MFQTMCSHDVFQMLTAHDVTLTCAIIMWTGLPFSGATMIQRMVTPRLCWTEITACLSISNAFKPIAGKKSADTQAVTLYAFKLHPQARDIT